MRCSSHLRASALTEQTSAPSLISLLQQNNKTSACEMKPRGASAAPDLHHQELKHLLLLDSPHLTHPLWCVLSKKQNQQREQTESSFMKGLSVCLSEASPHHKSSAPSPQFPLTTRDKSTTNQVLPEPPQQSVESHLKILFSFITSLLETLHPLTATTDAPKHTHVYALSSSTHPERSSPDPRQQNMTRSSFCFISPQVHT